MDSGIYCSSGSSQIIVMAIVNIDKAILDAKNNKVYYRQISALRKKSVKWNQMVQKKFDFFSLKKKN